MAKVKKKKKADIKDVAKGMFSRLNDKLGKGKQIFYPLNDGEDPANIERWYSTRSMLLDAIMSGNRDEGGAPGGRFIEIAGAESIGKSHICYQMARWVQENGGMVLYIDTELATSIANLKALGVDVEADTFIYAKVDSIEGVFEAAEEFLKELAVFEKDIPIAIFWDSVGGIGSRKERDRAYDDEQIIGLNAKQIALALRKITPYVNEAAASFVIVNQQYDLLNTNMYSTEKTRTKGGGGLKYSTTIRLGLNKVTLVYPEDMKRDAARLAGIPSCGIKIRAKTNKNKIASPHREIEFDIHFGVGIKEHMSIWEMFLKEKDGITIGDKMYVFKGGAYKSIETFDASTGESLNKDSFRQKNIEEKLMVEHLEEITKPCLKKLMDVEMSRDNKEANKYDPATDDPDTYQDSEENIMKELDQ
jgi:RecA/RadA recombinase